MHAMLASLGYNSWILTALLALPILEIGRAHV